MFYTQASRACLQLITGLLLVGGIGSTVADVFPEGVPTQLCAVSEVQVCEPDKDCYERPIANDDSIRFIKFSLPERLAVSTLGSGGQRRSVIERVSRQGKAIMLAGNEPGRGWSAVLEPATARLTLTLAEPGRGFVLFGLCTPER